MNNEYEGVMCLAVGIIEPILVSLKIEHRLRRCLSGGGLCSLANKIAAYEDM